MVPFLGEECLGGLLAEDQERRVAADVGEVGVHRDAPAPADLAVVEGEVAAGVGDQGVRGEAELGLFSAFRSFLSRPRKRSARRAAASIHGTSSASVFHHRASAPPGRSTRNASGTERLGSVQCQDWA